MLDEVAQPTATAIIDVHDAFPCHSTWHCVRRDVLPLKQDMPWNTIESKLLPMAEWFYRLG